MIHSKFYKSSTDIKVIANLLHVLHFPDTETMLYKHFYNEHKYMQNKSEKKKSLSKEWLTLPKNPKE